MKEERMKRYGIRIAVLALMGVFALILSMNRSQAAPSGTGVSSLAELKKAIADGEEEIYLKADIVFGKTYGTLEFKDGKSHKLNLNGHDIVMNNDIKRCNIRVSDETTLTICDTSTDNGDEQGRIRRGGKQFGGGVSVSGKGSTLILESGGIKECEANNGGGVAVTDGGSFIMNGGYVELCRASGMGRGGEETGNGNGVYISEGTFTMNGGMIRGNNSGNTMAHNGGAVWVGEDAVFTMNGGSIGDRVVLSSTVYGTQGGGNICVGNGAGVYVNGGEFYFNAGTFDSNYCNGKKGGGAIFIAQGSTFLMGKDAVLLANRCNENGGAIYIDRPKSCVINGGLIDGQNVSVGANSSVGGGIYITDATTQTIAIENLTIKRSTSNTAAGIYVGGGGLRLTGVTISDCDATDDAGGIYVAPNTVVVINDSTISGCTADVSDYNEKEGRGGAIYQADDSVVNLSGTTLTNNKSNVGGAIYLDDKAVCSITDGKITGNKADYYNYNNNNNNAGAGIYGLGTVKLGGAPVIKDNAQVKSDGETLVRTSNIYLDNDSYIYLIAPLSKDAEVGVWKAGNDRQITDNYGDTAFDTWRTKPSYYFFSDEDGYFAQKAPTLSQESELFHEVYIMKPKHEHNMQLVQEVPGTCAEAGCKEYYKCSDCNHIFRDIDGEYEYSVVKNNDGRYKELVTPKNPSNHVGGVDEERERVTEPSCTELGEDKITRTCQSCNVVLEIVSEPVAALGHDLKDITEFGGTTGVGQECKRDGCNYRWFIPDSNVIGCQHLDIDEYERVEPTCTQSGMKAYAVCKDCGKYLGYDADNNVIRNATLTDDEIRALVLDPLGHSAIKVDGSNDVRWFVVEDSEEAPTCTKDGKRDEYTMCSREGCGVHLDNRTVILPAHGHDFSDFYIRNCLILRDCSACGMIESPGECHDMVEVAKVEATCTEDGHSEFYVCSNCGKLFDYERFHTYAMPIVIDYSEVLLEAKGHKYGEWEILTEPTASSRGREIHYCTNKFNGVKCDAFEIRDMDTEVTYSFTKGADSEWTSGDEGTLDFTVKRSYKDEETYNEWFTGNIYVDDEKLSEDDAETSEGSVNIELKDSFLNTLKVGKHTIKVEFMDAEVSADFKVVEEDTTEESTDDTTEESTDKSTEESTDKTTEESTDDTTEESTDKSTEEGIDTTEVTEDDNSEDTSEGDTTEGTSEQISSEDTTSDARIEGNTENTTDTSSNGTTEVKTNDGTPVILLIVCAALSASMIVICLVMKVRKKKSQNGDEE